MAYKSRRLDEMDKLAARRARTSLGLVDTPELAECRRLAERIGKDQLKLKQAILTASIADAGQRQIADATGLSHMTVARIIRGEEGTPVRAPSEMAKLRRRRNRNSLSGRAAADESAADEG